MSDNRQLAAIMLTDIEGYTALIQNGKKMQLHFVINIVIFWSTSIKITQIYQ